MQRSITYKNPVKVLFYIVLFLLYSSLATIYIYLPPLLGILFFLLSKSIRNDDMILALIISFCLVVFEVNNGYLLFSSIIYLTLADRFAIPKIIQNFSCASCVKVSYILLSYIGYYLFLLLASKIFILDTPSFNYYIVYYIVIEFLFVSLL